MSVYFEIQADDPHRAIKFYSESLGWKFSEMKGLPVAYWTIDTGHAPGGGILQRPVKAPPPGTGTNAFVCSFEVAEFDATAMKILKLGGIIAMAKFEVPGKCWQGYFIDTEGNTFGIFQPI
jgi:uncharacterized protein